MKKLFYALVAVLLAVTAVAAVKRDICPCDYAFRFIGPTNPTPADVTNPLNWVRVDCQFFAQCPSKEVACGICVNKDNLQTIGGVLHPISIFTAQLVPPFNAVIPGAVGPRQVLAAYNRKP